MLASQMAAERVTTCIWALVRHLRHLRELNGWTPEYMAALINVEVRTIHRIEQEVQLPKFSTLKAMVFAFGYEVPHVPILFTSKPSRSAITKKGTRTR